MAKGLKSKMKAIMAERTQASNKRKLEAYEEDSHKMRGDNKRPCLPHEKMRQEDKKSCLPLDKPTKYLGGKEDKMLEEDSCSKQDGATVEEGFMTVSLLKHQRTALAWMEKREALSKGFPMGGILADDQGLGKTISTMALILKNRSPRPIGNDGNGGTLVVCPTSVVRQWAAELKAKASEKADLTFLLYHGPNRKKHAHELGMYDVILTTYAIVALENPTPKSWKEDGLGFDGNFLDIKKWRVGQAKAQSRVDNNALKKKKKFLGPLSKMKWFRVILDEAQCIRNASTMTARAVWGLDTKRRWCLTGTPLQNKLGDLYSYLRFLQYGPYEIYVKFHNQIKRHVEKSSQHKPEMKFQAEAYKLVRSIFKDILLRRTKVTRIAGQLILDLPPRIVNLEEVEFTPEEADFYRKLELEVLSEIWKFLKSGKSLTSKFIISMVFLLRMRQACNHFSLVTKWKEIASNKGITINDFERLCDACHDVATSDIMTILCGHVCCKDCVDLADNECPICGKALESYERKPSSGSLIDNEDKEMRNKKWGCSSKMKAAMRKIQDIPVGEKALVFSQWTGMLDLLEKPLQEMGVNFCRLDGTMSIAARDQAVRNFNNDPSVRVILMSLKAASLGLNMVAASHVLLLDIWWNPTVEEQAIDRAHRIGQTRPVIVTRFYVKDSVEEKVLEIQKQKRTMVELALGKGEIGNLLNNKLTEENFRTLFGIRPS